jgi:molybdopterin-synthase adenylyltransferase
MAFPPRLSPFSMNTEAGLRRYSSHLSLPQIGRTGQAAIREASITLVGLGGLGCAVAPCLVAAGVGRLQLYDFDTVAESNLARQTLYTPSDIGAGKAALAAQRLALLNPETEIEQHAIRVDERVLNEALADTTLIIDASDNFGTRLAVNRASLGRGIPWVMGACVRLEGQLMLFDPRQTGAPCYRCVYGQAPDQLEDCPGAGVMSTVAAMVGTTMAHLALMHLAGVPHEPVLHLLDGQNFAWRRMQTERRADCPDCSG